MDFEYGSYGNYSGRKKEVLTASRVGDSNAIIRGYIRHACICVHGNGVEARRGDKPLADFDFILRDEFNRLSIPATTSTLTHGYFATVDEEFSPEDREYTTMILRVIPPAIYFVVDQATMDEFFPHLQQPKTGGYHVVFINRQDELYYEKKNVRVYVLYPPTRSGHLQTPFRTVYTMHDLTATHMQLDIIGANINAVPKFLSAKTTNGQMSTFTGDAFQRMNGSHMTEQEISEKLAMEERLGRQFYDLQADRKEKEAARRAQERPGEPVLNTYLSQACRMNIGPENDPTIVNEKPDNMTFTAVPRVQTCDNLDAYVTLMDSRTARSVGLPLGLLSLEQHSNEQWTKTLFHEWKKQCTPIRALLNSALMVFTELYYNSLNEELYKQTKEEQFLHDVSIQFLAFLDPVELETLIPFMKPAAVARHLANTYSLAEEDFDLERIRDMDQPAAANPKKKKKTTTAAAAKKKKKSS